jgi:3-phosphoshikimate 1-carboxyvinyltransferase
MKKYIVNQAEQLQGEVKVPGDKSISHRAAMIGSIAKGDTRIENFLRSDDCMRTIDCFRKMGIEIDFEDGTVIVKGKGLTGLHEPTDVFDVGNSGTTMRLITGILAGQKFHSTLTGDETIRRRPMGRVVEPLKKMGAVIHGRQRDNLAPLVIIGKDLRGIIYEMPMASAQVKSAVLLAGLYARGTTTVVEKEPTRDHTERMLEYFGAAIKREGKSISIEGGNEFSGKKVSVPGDISSAAFLMVAASIVPGSDILIRDVGVNPGRTGIIDVLHRMGAGIEVKNERILSNEPVADISVRFSQLNATELNGSIIPKIIDEIPVIAVAATQAKGKTVIKGAEELRFKESDRIKTTVRELKRLGANIEEARDGVIVYGPTKLKKGICQSYGDHRIAMISAIAGLAASDQIVVEKVECVETSFPGFASIINSLSESPLIIES